ncbi:hypothetical protein ACFL59_10160 [Planctomycetota bacterium]
MEVSPPLPTVNVAPLPGQRSVLVLPGLVLCLSAGAAFWLGAELAVLSGVLAAGPLVMGLARRPAARLILALLLLTVTPAALRLHELKSEWVHRCALSAERTADELLFVEQRPAAAIPQLEEALRLEPSFSVLHKLGLASLYADRPRAAVRSFERALRLPQAPESPMYRLGIRWLKGGQRDLALAALQTGARSADWFEGLR